MLGAFLTILAMGSFLLGGFRPGQQQLSAGEWVLDSLLLFFEWLYVAALRFWPVALSLLGIFGLQLWIKLQDKRNPPVPPPRGEQAPRSGWALMSLVLGSCGVLLIAFMSAGFFCAIFAILCGHMALYKIKKTSGATRGRGMAVAGLVMGYTALAVTALALVILPWHTSDRHNSELDTLGRGQQIFTSITSSMGPVVFVCWPKSGAVPNSTAFFTNVASSSQLRVNYAYFSAAGIKPYNGTNAAMFKAENNAWCVVADLNDDIPDTIPYLFTRNLRVTSLAELKGKVGDQLSGESPFGRKVLVLISKSGAAHLLKPDMLWSNILHGVTFTNRVLRP